MKSYKEQIENIAIEVNAGLTIYIAVHNKIFNEAATFRSFIKNLFSRGVPMSQLLQDVEKLIPVWNGIVEKVKSFSCNVNSSIKEDEKLYLELLARYTEALRETVSALVERQRVLNERSKGGRDNPITWDVYQQSERKYQDSIQQYQAIGQELNSVSHVIF